MSQATTPPLLQFIRRIARTNEGGERTDEQLLSRFVSDKDETAFAALVQRHGPMVLGVCSRVLRNAQEAEDAFQATFLVLLRRAHAISRPERLSNWLYGVAYRTALKARASVRRPREAMADVPASGLDPAEEAARRDLRFVLDEEVNRLPARYREPFILCYLKGQTHEEVASQVGCPRETVTTRLVRARERLRGQLIRRGLTFSAGTLATALSEAAATQAVQASLVEQTVRTAMLYSAGKGALPAAVMTLAEGVVRSMMLTKWKISAACLFGLALVLWGASWSTRHILATEAPTSASDDRLVVAPEGDVEEEVAETLQVSVQEMPPVVVKTEPQSGDTQVDASKVKEIRVTFSKNMRDKSWSWSQISDDTFPKTTGKIRYDQDKRTCILPVQLESGKTYVIWLNSAKFGNFKDTDGRSAVPYLLVFETK